MNHIFSHFERRKMLPLLFLSSFVAIYEIIMKINFFDFGYDLSLNRLSGFYHVLVNGEDDIGSPILNVIALFLIFIPMANFYRKDFNLTVTYCITRNKSQSSWYFQKVGGVLKLSLFCALVYRLAGQTVLFAKKIMTFSQYVQDLKTELIMVTLFWLYIAFWLLLMNDISLILGSKWVIPIGVLLNLLTAFDMYRVQTYSSFGFRLNPLVNMFLPIHSESASLPPYGLETVTYFEKFPIWSSYVYFAITIAVFIAVGYIILLKSDLGTMTED